MTSSASSLSDVRCQRDSWCERHLVTASSCFSAPVQIPGGTARDDKVNIRLRNALVAASDWNSPTTPRHPFNRLLFAAVDVIQEISRHPHATCNAATASTVVAFQPVLSGPFEVCTKSAIMVCGRGRKALPLFRVAERILSTSRDEIHLYL